MTSAQWLQLLLSYALQASLVIGVAWMLDRWSRESRVKTLIWTACFVSLLGVLAAGLLLPHWHLFHPWAHADSARLLAAAELEQAVGQTFLAIWLFGCGVMVVRSVIEFWRVQRFIASCPKLSNRAFERVQTIVAPGSFNQHGKLVEVRISPEELGPFCYQFHQPLIFLPQSLLEGDAVELSHVLVHELTHLRTQHPLQLFLQKLVQCVLWFHPLVWISTGRASLVREFVCDDAAIHDGASTVSYLRTLLRIVEQKSNARSGLLGIGRSVSEVRVRAERLASTPANSRRSYAVWSAGVVVLVAALSSQVWLPTDPLVSARSTHSGWPSWSAQVLHALDVPANDFEAFDARTQLHELEEER